MRKLIALAFLIPTIASAATWFSDGSQLSIQTIHDAASTHDGDIIDFPAGITAHWTGEVTFTKKITLQGHSIVDPHCGGDWANAGACGQPHYGTGPDFTPPPNTDPPLGTHTDSSIILDDSNTGNRLIMCKGNGGQRITGLSFLPGSTSVQKFCGIEISNTNDALVGAVRVDHCYFGDNELWSPNIINTNVYNFGIFDHNVSITEHGVILNYPGRQGNYTLPQGSGDGGDGAFAEAVGWGGPKFFYVEDNYIKHGGDNEWGGKTVYRYNHMHGENTRHNKLQVGAVIVTHGNSRQNNARGPRAHDVYNNHIFWDNDFKDEDGADGGASYYHDNMFWDHGRSIGGLAVNYYRMMFKYAGTFAPGIQGGANGFNIWDVNATEADGTHIDGHSPFVFDSGTLSAGTTCSGGTIVDTTKNWTPANKWRGFTVKRLSDGATVAINSSTTTTLSCATIFGDGGGGLCWQSGQGYQIGKVVQPIDAPGGGVSVINRAVPAQIVQSKDPLYSFNNQYVDIPGQKLNWGSNGAGTSTVPLYMQFIFVNGVDYFNNTQMPGYIPYCYPHPLVSGIPCTPGTPTPTATATATPAATPTSTPSATATATSTPTATPFVPGHPTPKQKRKGRRP